jgi:predicted dehydrogenase
MTFMTKPSESANNPQSKQIDRRLFLKNTSAAVVTGSVLATMAGARAVHGDDKNMNELRFGLVGCGGRGTGAAINAANAHSENKLVALCDVFSDRLDICRKTLDAKIPEKQRDVKDDHCFTDFDGYKKLLQSDIDVVLLCTSPHFRPEHLRAAIEAGKHVFCEKPVAVDGPGVRSVLETTELAKKKNLSIVSGLCWRYDKRVVATMDRILDGTIGDIVATQENYLTGELWYREPREGWTEMETQMRNWLYYTWLSGDHIAEQHIHSLDKSLWLHGDKLPTKCYSLGGRQKRTDKRWGNIYDHMATVYEWENGTKTFSFCRQQSNCFSDTEDYILGTKGSAQVLKFTLSSPDGKPVWKFEGDSPGMYDWEHVKLFEGIRNGKPINNGEYMSYSTLMAIMGREASYTGLEITSEAMLNSQKRLGPTEYNWGDIEVPEIAIPGVTKFS